MAFPFLSSLIYDHPSINYGGFQRYYYDNNGNVVNRRWGLGNQQTLTWDHENHLSGISGTNGYYENYLYDADGQRVKKSDGIGGVTFYPNSHYEVTNETVWADDAVPGGSTLAYVLDNWNWQSGNPASGASYHYAPPASGLHQHYFYGATETLTVGTGDVLYAYIYLDPSNLPQEIMLQWYDGDWEQRAYWGQNLIAAGTDGTVSRRYMGAMPSATGWVRLEVPASLVGLEGVTINGMAFTLHGGHAWWDRAGVRHNSWRGTKYYQFNGQTVAMRKNGVLTYLHGDHLGSTVLTTNGSGNFTGQDLRHAYGRQRAGTELGTENRFTGQKLDGAGLMYFNARYYDPELGHFLSPDSLVPDASNLFDSGQKIKLDMVVLFGRFLKKLVKGYNGSPMQTNMVISSKVNTRVRQVNLYLGKN
jgi:RHS repeat-associated protein